MKEQEKEEAIFLRHGSGQSMNFFGSIDLSLEYVKC
jgi:hypothetical protein